MWKSLALSAVLLCVACAARKEVVREEPPPPAQPAPPEVPIVVPPGTVVDVILTPIDEEPGEAAPRTIIRETEKERRHRYFRVMADAGPTVVEDGGCMDTRWALGVNLEVTHVVALEFAAGTGIQSCNGWFRFLHFRAGPEFALTERIRFSPGVSTALSFPVDDPIYSDVMASLRATYVLYEWLEVGVDPHLGRDKSWDFATQKWHAGFGWGVSGSTVLRF